MMGRYLTNVSSVWIPSSEIQCPNKGGGGGGGGGGRIRGERKERKERRREEEGMVQEGGTKTKQGRLQRGGILLYCRSFFAVLILSRFFFKSGLITLKY